jgi:DNA-binding transcriptional LysR family regulator
VVELKRLRCFVAVAEELHFGRAAVRMHMAQPPFSVQIRRLEDAVGVALLSRGTRHVALTPAGRTLYEYACRILGEIEVAIAATRQVARGEAGTLSVGFVSTADYGLLPQIVRAYRMRHSGVVLRLREMTSDEQLEALRQNSLDVAVVIGPVDSAFLAYRFLGREPLIVALPETHALAGSIGAIPVKRLAPEPFILFPRPLAPHLYDAILGLCSRAGFTPRIAQEAIQMQTIVSLVSAGLGIAIVPGSMRNLARAGVCYVALGRPPAYVETGMAWRIDDESPILQAFREVAEATKTPQHANREGPSSRRRPRD